LQLSNTKNGCTPKGEGEEEAWDARASKAIFLTQMHLSLSLSSKHNGGGRICMALVGATNQKLLDHNVTGNDGALSRSRRNLLLLLLPSSFNRDGGGWEREEEAGAFPKN
jgi:hypothetical protein